MTQKQVCRGTAPHLANFDDIDQKYADVTDAADIFGWHQGLRRPDAA